jgi:hypothetical protein
LEIPSETLYVRSQLLAQKNETILESLNIFDDQVGEALYASAQLYLYQINRAAKLLEALMFIRNTRKVAEAIAGIDLQTQILFGVPVSIMPGVAFIDMDQYISRPFALDGNPDKKKTFLKLLGMTTSFHEHRVLEGAFAIDAVSAVKVIQIARERGVSIEWIDAANLITVLPLLQVPITVKTDIVNAVNAGQTVLIPRQAVQINEWSGVGYIVEDPATNRSAYLISGGLAGGSVTRSGITGLALVRLLQRTGTVAIGKFKAGEDGLPANWDEAFNLLSDAASIIPIELLMFSGGLYVPQGSFTYTKDALLKSIKKSTNWVFYFSGHGHDGLLAATPGVEHVDASDFSVDQKIVFLNACRTGQSPTFAASFGTLDQMHRGKPRDEVLVGWQGPCALTTTAGIAVSWWALFAMGLTARRAAELAWGNPLSLPDKGPNRAGTTMVFHGNENTKLWEDKNFEIP